MLYSEAIEIAKLDPGAAITRGPDGRFIVRKSDGTVLGGEDGDSDRLANRESQKRQGDSEGLGKLVVKLNRENLELKQSIKLLEQQLDQFRQLKDENDELKDENDELEQSLNREKARVRKLKSELSSVHEEHKNRLSAAREKYEEADKTVNDLQEKLDLIPPADLTRYEEEAEQQRSKEQERKKRVERERIIGLVRDGKLNYEQLLDVLNRSHGLGMTDDDRVLVSKEIKRVKPVTISADCFVVHATTDGQ